MSAVRLSFASGVQPTLCDPRLFAAWPGMGNVALGAGVYLQSTLGARQIAQLDGRDLYHASSVKVEAGVLSVPQIPKTNLFVWRNPSPQGDLALLLGSSQPPPDKAADYAAAVVETARRLGAEIIYTAAAAPVNRPPTETPRVWGVATHRELLTSLQGLGVHVMDSGEISGLNGLVLGVAKEMGLRGMCLLGEIPIFAIQVPNPQASLAVLKVLVEVLGVDVDLSGLAGHAQRAVADLRRMISLVARSRDEGARPDDESADEEEEEQQIVPEEEIPVGVRRRIEELFEQAKGDKAHAPALKAELDAWGLFHEYEDRFLDLFQDKRDSHH
jgi:proteasome assembly chaperone (PAC2) family protein